MLVNAIIGYVQEAKAVAAIEALAQSMPTEATVHARRREDAPPGRPDRPRRHRAAAAGDKVPADLRLVLERELRVDESALTGESVPVEKTADTSKRDSALADRHGMAYASTLVTYGAGAGVVVATGDATEVGQDLGAHPEATDLATPLTRKIAEFAPGPALGDPGLAGVTFVVGLLRGEDIVDMFKAAVALAVARSPRACRRR